MSFSTGVRCDVCLAAPVVGALGEFSPGPRWEPGLDPSLLCGVPPSPPWETPLLPSQWPFEGVLPRVSVGGRWSWDKPGGNNRFDGLGPGMG